MSSFTRAALYTKEEIKSALDYYKTEVSWAEGLIKVKVTEAEAKFTPSLWDKIAGHKTLSDRLNNMFMTYEEELFRKGYISFTDLELKRIESLNAYENFYCLGVWIFDKQYSEIKSLFNGGKDCYLNPLQAEFINRYKHKE